MAVVDSIKASLCLKILKNSYSLSVFSARYTTNAPASGIIGNQYAISKQGSGAATKLPPRAQSSIKTGKKEREDRNF